MSANLFDASFYRAANPDLATYDNNQLAAHFFTYGLDEGRLFSPLVNLNLYRASNSDLGSFSNRQLYEHLDNNGVAEGRKFSEFFDLNYYRSRNGDLAQLNNEQLFWHAQNYGVAEGRRMSAFADINFYKGANGDLASLTNVQALQHLVAYGVNEGRRFSGFVDLNLYNAANPDLKAIGFNNKQLLEHLTTYGVNDGRRFSAGFDINYYRGFYSDLRQAGLNNTQLWEHFQDNGLREGRASSESFNVTYYQANNADLRAAGFNNQQALQHFEIYGLREGRIGAPASSISLAANRDDNTLGTAANLGVLNGSRSFTNQFVGTTDSNDYYRFTLAQTSNVNVNLTGLSRTVKVELIYDSNANGRYDENNYEQLSYDYSSSSTSINSALGAGTYFLRVFSSSNANTNYNLGLTATPTPATTPRDPGNTLTTAVDIGTVSSTPTSFRDFVGSADRDDYYRFTLAQTSNVNVNLTGLSGTVQVELIYDSNGNGQYDSGESVYSTYSSSSTSINSPLAAGTYFLRVFSYSNANTNYNLGLTATPAPATTPRDPGNTLTTALDIGTVSSTPTSFRDFVGSADRDDYYRFSLGSTSNVNLSVTGVTNDVRLALIYDINGNGEYDEYSEQVYYSNNSGDELISQTLGAGTYLARVYTYSSSSNTNYTLGVSATPNLPTTPRDPGNTLGEALDIGILTGARIFRDFVGVTDRNDYYRFTLLSNRNFSLSLTGLTDDADVELIQDIDNDGRVDYNEVLRYSYNSGSNNESINTLLAAGTYYIRVYSDYYSDNTSYTLSLLV
ncbi:MAG: PPC domain-containing protein [Nostocaceae cyanobacterium]|nr:PPC domain-containing protein [Nostocaceae cyanobacterium]